MAKTKQKELSFSEIGFLCLVMSALSTTFFSLPLYTYFFNFLGFGGIAYDIMNSKNRKHDQWFKDRGLNIDDRCPRLVERKETPYGSILKFIKPHAITSEDFQKNSVALNEYFGDGKGDVIVNYVNGFVFVELHNKELKPMYDLRDVSEKDLKTKGILEIPFGQTFSDIFRLDIEKAPNILIAGETGGGKSNAVNLIITFLLKYKATKHNIKIYLMDFKNGIEFNRYTKHPNVVSLSTDVCEALDVFQEIEKEMNRRYEICKKADVKDIKSYNKKFPKKQIPPIVVVIDEFAEFYLTKNKDIISKYELLVSRVRASSIHLIAATQRPDKDVINGRIKINMPTRICYMMADDTNSQIVLDANGAEKLSESGHCLIKHNGKIEEIQTYFMDEDYSKQLISESVAEISGENLESAITAVNNITNRNKPTTRSFLSKKEGGEGIITTNIKESKPNPPPTNRLKMQDLNILNALDKLSGGGNSEKK